MTPNSPAQRALLGAWALVFLPLAVRSRLPQPSPWAQVSLPAQLQP
jgi:hypothetical protein